MDNSTVIFIHLFKNKTYFNGEQLYLHHKKTKEKKTKKKQNETNMLVINYNDGNDDFESMPSVSHSQYASDHNDGNSNQCGNKNKRSKLRNFGNELRIGWKLRDAPLVTNFELFYEVYDSNSEKVFEQDCESLTRLNIDGRFNFEYIKDIDDFVDGKNLISFDQIGRFGVVYMIPFKNELMKVTRVTRVTRDSNNKHNNNNNTRIVEYLIRSVLNIAMFTREFDFREQRMKDIYSQLCQV